MMKENYMILFDTYDAHNRGSFTIIKTNDFKDCCIQHLKDCGSLTDIIEQGFAGFDSSHPEPLIKYTNMFLNISDVIDNIVKLQYFALNKEE